MYLSCPFVWGGGGVRGAPEGVIGQILSRIGWGAGGRRWIDFCGSEDNEGGRGGHRGREVEEVANVYWKRGDLISVGRGSGDTWWWRHGLEVWPRRVAGRRRRIGRGGGGVARLEGIAGGDRAGSGVGRG